LPDKVRRKSRGGPPSSSQDRIFNYIAGHREAITTGDFSAAKLYTRCLIIGGATTRKGTIALANYLAELIRMPVRDGIHLDTQIDGKPWVEMFLYTLAGELRRMGSEFPKATKK